ARPLRRNDGQVGVAHLRVLVQVRVQLVAERGAPPADDNVAGDEPSPSVHGQTKTVRNRGSTTKNAMPAHFHLRVTSFSAMRAPKTTNHIAHAYQGMDSNKNIGPPPFAARGLRAVWF